SVPSRDDADRPDAGADAGGGAVAAPDAGAVWGEDSGAVSDEAEDGAADAVADGGAAPGVERAGRLRDRAWHHRQRPPRLAALHASPKSSPSCSDGSPTCLH